MGRGRPRCQWEVNIQIYRGEMRCEFIKLNSTSLGQVQRRKLLKKATKLRDQ
jgi:hypothetical protein